MGAGHQLCLESHAGPRQCHVPACPGTAVCVSLEPSSCSVLTAPCSMLTFVTSKSCLRHDEELGLEGKEAGSHVSRP